jgi:hypothetical protein
MAYKQAGGWRAMTGRGLFKPGSGIAVGAGSPFSSDNGGQCVEVAANLSGAVVVRDSKDPDGPKLLLTTAGWRSFAPPAMPTRRPGASTP